MGVRGRAMVAIQQMTVCDLNSAVESCRELSKL